VVAVVRGVGSAQEKAGAMRLRDLLPRSATARTATLSSTPAETVTSSPLATVAPKRARKPPRKPAKGLFPVANRHGIIVATSGKPVAEENPATHAVGLLRWLQAQEGFAGQAVLKAGVCGNAVAGTEVGRRQKLGKKLNDISGFWRTGRDSNPR
jgi:hypothetical protein